MNANDVIESWIEDVARRLPRSQRNDVAFELRALLGEELQAKADEAGHPADAAMATALVNAFGAPAEVAARYRPTVTIIDPVDGRAFLRAMWIGLAILWAGGLLSLARQPMHGTDEFMRALAQWWGSTITTTLCWPGLLVIGFGLSAWSRRRFPQPQSAWKARTAERSPGSRVAMVFALIGILFGVFVLLDPRWVLDVFFGGRAAPAAYQALTYTDAFRHRQAPFLFACLLLNVPLLLAVIIKGAWTQRLRRLEDALGLAICALMVWIAADGPVFQAQASDRMFKGILVLLVALTLLTLGLRWLRRVRPAPTPAR